MVKNLFANWKTGFYRIPGGAMVWLDGKMCPLKEGGCEATGSSCNGMGVPGIRQEAEPGKPLRRFQ
ncbi:MAG: hypothetical protein ACYCZT_09305 [Thiobacillus sp.]